MPSHQELRSLLPSYQTVGKARACNVSRVCLPAQGMVGSLLRMVQGRSLQTWGHLRKRDKGDKEPEDFSLMFMVFPFLPLSIMARAASSKLP